ncbi:MAG: tyrosine-type recombinase/integrase [Terriglobales bacterium]
MASDQERETLLANASPRMYIFILLCADLGLRHRTATKITPRMYDPRNRTLTFTTKGNVHQTLPVTEEIASILRALPLDIPPDLPIINYFKSPKGGHTGKNARLSRSWTKLKEKCGVRAELRVHDLRRTSAEEIWDATKDLRTVQAHLGHRSIATTARYLANRVGLEEKFAFPALGSVPQSLVIAGGVENLVSRRLAVT